MFTFSPPIKISPSLSAISSSHKVYLLPILRIFGLPSLVLRSWSAHISSKNTYRALQYRSFLFWRCFKLTKREYCFGWLVCSLKVMQNFQTITKYRNVRGTSEDKSLQLGAHNLKTQFQRKLASLLLQMFFVQPASYQNDYLRSCLSLLSELTNERTYRDSRTKVIYIPSSPNPILSSGCI